MIFENYSLKKHNTFGLNARAARFCSPENDRQIIECLRNHLMDDKPCMVIGAGSNLLFTRDFDGLIINPAAGGIEAGPRRGSTVEVTAGAGVVWDDFVNWAVSNNLGGTENLSLIPGHTGASAVQNIGAYGAEVSEIIAQVHAIEIPGGTKRVFSGRECSFGYRHSIFKGELKGRYIITAVTFNLTDKPEFRLSYGNLQQEAEKDGKITLASIRNAVIATRQSKLPDPAVTGNAGSFFKNPVIDAGLAAALQGEFPAVPVYPAGNSQVKIAAAWLIDQCGWKGYRQGDAGVHDKQALVLVNHGNATGDEIFNLSEKIRKSVINRFGIDLEREVEVI